MNNNRFINISLSSDDCKNENHPHHSSVPLASPQKPGIFRQKPQIQSVPGISPKERKRYQVSLDGEILGDQLTLDEALQLVKEGEL